MDFAIFDFAVSYLGVYLLSPLLTKITSRFGWRPTRLQWLYLVLPLSVVFHLMFGVHTPLTEMVIDPHGGYIAKILILLMLYLGIKKSK